ATVVRSASRSTVTICSSVNRLFLIGSSWVGSHLPRNHWSGKTGQVRGFKPPPEWWTYFSANGASEKEIRAAFLECGSSTPGYYTEFLTPDRKYFPETDLNEAISVTKCMKNSGFPYKGRIDLCAGGGTDMYGNRTKPPDVPSCKPDAMIPKRSVENRLNSLYCKTYPKTKICQPDYDPSAVETSTQTNPKPISVAPSTDLATKLQDQVQKDSNAQMNQLLQGSGSRR
ncbi:MAG: hypothetical protein Q8K91_08945, partial [Hylemonella sp.]|nr:hypothetical protein [Hylemonella sp.]MDP1937316.1 hypothetical protein [Hylemonella sp.]